MKTSRRRHIGANIGAAGLLVVVLGLGVVGCGGIVAPTQPPTNEQQQAPINGQPTATQGQTQADGHIGDTLNLPNSITAQLKRVTATPVYDSNGAFLDDAEWVYIDIVNHSNAWQQLVTRAEIYAATSQAPLTPYYSWDGTLAPSRGVAQAYSAQDNTLATDGPFQVVFIDGAQQVAWTFTYADIQQVAP